jgi:hypothetical protein
MKERKVDHVRDGSDATAGQKVLKYSQEGKVEDSEDFCTSFFPSLFCVHWFWLDHKIFILCRIFLIF